MHHKLKKSLVFQEYGEFVNANEIADKLNLSNNDFWHLLTKAVKGFSVNGKTETFLETKKFDSFRFVGIAGIFSLSRNITVEIVPKFLNMHSKQWRDDFLNVVLLTQKGQLFQNNLIASKPRDNSDLYDIICISWLDLFEKNSRYLTKNYITTNWRSFFIDGEVEAEDLISPNSQGYLQQGIRLSKSNEVNRILLKSALNLRSLINLPNNIIRLDKAIEILKNALKDPISGRQMPINVKRENRWHEIVELSKTISSNWTMGYDDSGTELLPGYILNTNIAWEKLVQLMIKKAFPEFSIRKMKYFLGERKVNSDLKKKIESTPDISLHRLGRLELIADAKYKVTKDEINSNRLSTVSSSDIYEAIAFLKASKTNILLLFYPGTKFIETSPIESQPIEIIEVGEYKVIAFSIGLQGLSQKGGILRLRNNFKEIMHPYL